MTHIFLLKKAWQLSNDIPRAESLEELLEQSDFITIHIPYTDKNRNIIGEDEINVMKDTAVLLNYSRWGIVDEDAVIKALDAKKLRLFITDFSSEKILNHKQIIVTPHLGGTTEEAEVNGAKMAANTLKIS